jgi:DNA-directed RNA polymerase specialized sigma24 family protein
VGQEARSEEKNRSTREGLDRLLSLLDPDREKAGAQLIEITKKLQIFFSSKERVRSRADVELLTDRTIDRVIKKVGEEGDIRDLQAYGLAVARYILLEYIKEPETIPLDAEPGGEIATNRQDIEANLIEAELLEIFLVCTRQCLQKLKPEDRELFLRAKRIRGEEKKKQEELAKEFGMIPSALPKKVYRMREKLEQCGRQCVRRKSGINPTF